MFHVPDQFRVRNGAIGTDPSYGNNGVFILTYNGRKAKARKMQAIVSDGMGWEHVSASLIMRRQHAPTWNQMCFIKDLFWDDEDTVIQYHPPKSEYVNCHPYVLHLWRKAGEDFVRPPSIMVGPKS